MTEYFTTIYADLRNRIIANHMVNILVMYQTPSTRIYTYSDLVKCIGKNRYSNIFYYRDLGYGGYEHLSYGATIYENAHINTNQFKIEYIISEIK